MINTVVNLSEIEYEPEEPGNLVESIRLHGMAIPVQCIHEKGHYVCVDGRRRLSALARLAEKDPSFRRVEILITNDYSHAGSGFWGNTLNRH